MVTFLSRASFLPGGFHLHPLFLPSPLHLMTVPAGDKTQPLAPRTEAAASPQEPPHGPIHLDRPLIRVQAGEGIQGLLNSSCRLLPAAGLISCQHSPLGLALPQALLS